MKKPLCILILICCAFLCFAQSTNIYEVDLSKMPAVSDNKCMTFDKATKTFTVKRENTSEWAGIYLWLNNFDISDYNIARVKYKVTGDYGFHFELDYSDVTLDWTEKQTYCPSYLNEMVIPLMSNQRRLNGIAVAGTWTVPYEQFIIESVTLEKVTNPVKTDVYANINNDPPVIDTARNGTINEKIDAWDFIKEIGTGLQYEVFVSCSQDQDFGMDIYHSAGFSKSTKEQIHSIKEKGFKTLRLQTNPGIGHLLDSSYTIDPRYTKAIKQVVDWAIAEDMYVIICGPWAELTSKEAYKRKIEEGNIHYAGDVVSEKYKKQSEKFIKAVWKQYAEAFNNSYDEHLIFETLNEPVDYYHEHAFSSRPDCKECKKDFEILNEYNQLIVDTIRASGGNNASRFILIEGLVGGDFDGNKGITTNLFKLPKDKAKNKLIPTLHHYPMGSVPDGCKNYYTDNIKDLFNQIFATLDELYFSKHIPVYISEVGHLRKIPIMERINCIKDFMAEVVKPNRSCAVTMHTNGNPEWDWGYYDSYNLKWYDTEYIDTILYGAQGKEYPLSAEFLKNNETKIESIVGKNLLKEPLEKKNWGMSYKVASDVFYHSTPAKYKIEFEIEKTGNNPELDFAYTDCREVWHGFHNTPLLKKIRVKGGTFQGNIKVKANKLILTIDENLAKELADGNGVYLNGQDIIIKSMTVVE